MLLLKTKICTKFSFSCTRFPWKCTTLQPINIDNFFHLYYYSLIAGIQRSREAYKDDQCCQGRYYAFKLFLMEATFMKYPIPLRLNLDYYIATRGAIGAGY